MSRTALRRNAFRLALTGVVLGSLFILAACGGGGGGGPTPVTYAGLVTQATVTSTNAEPIFSTVWNGGSSSGALTLLSTSSGGAPTNSSMVALFRQMKDRALSAASGLSGASRALTAVAVNESIACVTGSGHASGDMDPITNLGTLNMTFSNCNLGDGFTFNGTITFKITAFDTVNDFLTDGTLSFTLWTVKSADSDVSMTGSFRIQQSFADNSETMTVNMDGRDNSTGETFRFKNIVWTVVYDDITWPTTYTETINGRVYVEMYGYVDITTLTPLNYTNDYQLFPDSGELVLTGANGTISIKPLSDTYVQIQVDFDNDAVYDFTHDYLWAEI